MRRFLALSALLSALVIPTSRVMAQVVTPPVVFKTDTTKVVAGPSCPCSETNKVVDSALAHMKTPRLDRLTKEMALVRRQIDSLKKVANAPTTSVVSDTATRNELTRLNERLTSLDQQVAVALKQVNAPRSASSTTMIPIVEVPVVERGGMSTGAKWALGIIITGVLAGTAEVIAHNSSHTVNVNTNVCQGPSCR